MEAIDWIVGGVLGFTSFGLYSGSRAFASSARDIESAEKVQPGAKLLDRLEQDQCLPYAAVGGYVHPDGDCTRCLSYGTSNSPCVVKSSKTLEHAKEYNRASRGWYNSSKVVSRTFQSVPFVLSASAGSAVGQRAHNVTVHAGEGDFGNVLTKVESSFEKADNDVGRSILGLFSGHKVTGYEYAESVLPVAQFVTVLGKVSLVNGSIVVESPARHKFILTSQALQDLATEYYNRSKGLRVLSYLCLTGLAIFVVFRTKKLIQHKYKEYLRAHETKQMLDQLKEQGSASDETDGSDLCCVCLDRRSTIVIMDCRHLCVCAECSVALEDCPICRGPIVDRVATYR